MEDTAKLGNETEYKQQKMMIRKLIKQSKIQHYHEALNNARKILKSLEPTKATSSWKIEANQIQFAGSPQMCQQFQ